MTDEEYLFEQQKLFIVATLVRDIKLAEFIKKAERAEAIGPFIDPTLYLRAGENLRRIKNMAQALKALQDFIEKEFPVCPRPSDISA